MENQNLQYHVRQTQIHKDVYRTSNLGRFARLIFSILLVGQSPITHRDHYRRRYK